MLVSLLPTSFEIFWLFGNGAVDAGIGGYHGDEGENKHEYEDKARVETAYPRLGVYILGDALIKLLFERASSHTK